MPFAHASTPEMGNNALTALLQLLASVPLEESELKNDIIFLSQVYPHGDGKGAGLGVAMSDEESGELTLSLDLMNYDGKILTGSYDCRAPLCATKENLYDTAEQNMKKGGFSMEGSAMVPATPRSGGQSVRSDAAAVLYRCHRQTGKSLCDRRRNVCPSPEKRCCFWLRGS